MIPHGNSRQNQKLHHLYEIFDDHEEEVFKYGISADEIDSDGLSNRLKKQLKLFNLVANTLRFIGRILVHNIPGRKEALDLEDKYINDYEQKHGKRPRGNPPKGQAEEE